MSKLFFTREVFSEVFNYWVLSQTDDMFRYLRNLKKMAFGEEGEGDFYMYGLKISHFSTQLTFNLTSNNNTQSVWINLDLNNDAEVKGHHSIGKEVNIIDETFESCDDLKQFLKSFTVSSLIELIKQKEQDIYDVLQHLNTLKWCPTCHNEISNELDMCFTCKIKSMNL